MSSPLDQLVQNRTGAVKAARIFSNVVSPPTIFAAVGMAFAWSTLPFWPGFLWAAVYGLIASLLPILFVLFLLKTGRIAELHMSNTRERLWPYISATLCAGAVYLIAIRFDGPALIRCLALFSATIMAVLGMINYFWLISFHMTAATAAFVMIGLVFGWTVSLITVPIMLLTAWVRLFLKRHTVAQVIGGTFLGGAGAYIMVFLGCF